MNIIISDTAELLGTQAAETIAKHLKRAITLSGSARLLLSTGASQFETISALLKHNVEWSKVEMFHLDEYVNLEETHIASFRKYLKERFISQVNLKAYYLIDGNIDPQACIRNISEKLQERPIDVGVIGIGENGHIAFNDPPCNFEDTASFKVVDLEDRCKQQQVNEGWFPSLADVPNQAITMTIPAIMSCKVIISSVPHKAKATAIKDTLTKELTPMVPATILKQHKNWNLFIDKNSASELFVL